MDIPGNKFIILNKEFDLRGTRKNPVLYNFKERKSFDLSNDQFMFLNSCTGENSFSKIVKIWSPISFNTVKEFIKNLVDIKAVTLLDRRPKEIRVFNNLLKGPYLRAVHLELTNRCNLRCLHCYQDKYFSQEEISTDNILKLIDDLKKLNILKIGISGGEPFLRKDLFRILKYIENNKITISSILTNGVLINRKIINQLLLLNSPIILFISLDGITPKGIRLRGGTRGFRENLISKIIKKIALCRENGIPVWINTCVTKDNVKELPTIYRTLKGLKIQGWRLALPKRIGMFLKTHDQFTVPHQEIFDAYKELIKSYLEDKKGERNIFELQIEYFFREEVLKNLILYNPNSFVCDYEDKHLSCCVKPNGDVTPCALLVDKIIGNIKKESIKKIWYSREMQKIKKLTVRDIKCSKDCKNVLFCGCGCRAVALSYNNDIRGRDNDACAAVIYFKNQITPLLNKYLDLKIKFQE